MPISKLLNHLPCLDLCLALVHDRHEQLSRAVLVVYVAAAAVVLVVLAQ